MVLTDGWVAVIVNNRVYIKPFRLSMRERIPLICQKLSECPLLFFPHMANNINSISILHSRWENWLVTTGEHSVYVFHHYLIQPIFVFLWISEFPCFFQGIEKISGVVHPVLFE